MLDDPLLKKIDDALSYRFLIGDINFTAEEKEEIRNEFFSVYSRNSKKDWKGKLSEQELDILSITLILVAKNYPKDWRGKEFWPKIAERINVYSTDTEETGAETESHLARPGSVSSHQILIGALRV